MIPIHVSEYEKVFRIREVLRATGVLPEVSTDEFITAILDGERNGWFVPNVGDATGQERLAEAWITAWIKTPVPSAHMGAGEWVDVLRKASRDTKLDVTLREDTVELYRGAVDGEECGLSWTTSKAVAVFFSLRQSPRGVTGKVMRAVVPRGDVVADLRRVSVTEQEVIVDPSAVVGDEVRMDESSRRYWFDRYVKDMKRLAVRYGVDVPPGAIPEGYSRPSKGNIDLSPQQSVDPLGKKYTPKVYTPSIIRWPLPHEVMFVRVGNSFGTLIHDSVGWSV